MSKEIQGRRHQEEIAEHKRQEEMTEQKHEEEIQIAEQRRQEEIQMEERRRREEKNKNTRNGSERMKWNLSCKKYVLEQKEVCVVSRISVTQKLKLKLERAVNKIYCFGNLKRCPTSVGRIKADIEVDNVKAESISIYIVPDDAQSVDLIIADIHDLISLISLIQKWEKEFILDTVTNYFETFQLMKK
ncbi:hypothetical protein AVEN_110296-1 [Araneus ventricosus]|uniref:Uncharacterized protein n=1 Tax=Araneus ventricosus TaxID=182803 RepID=A0A4Y2PHY6_ARAVE|nr:hypothetical protein AVEN_110296-1 [Araneus ventricosus]